MNYQLNAALSFGDPASILKLFLDDHLIASQSFVLNFKPWAGKCVGMRVFLFFFLTVAAMQVQAGQSDLDADKEYAFKATQRG